jgi:solute carrier family 35 protein E1
MARGKEEKSAKGKTFPIMVVVFCLWYATSASYNVYNAKMRVYPYEYAVGTLQLVAGMVYALPLWALNIRTFPKLSWSEIIYNLWPVALLNTLGHITAVFAMFQKGGGSFTHVIKASEPVVSVILTLLFNGTLPKPFTGLSLLPIAYGVAYASTLGNLNIATMKRELQTPMAALAMASNICFAMRSLVRKNMDPKIKAKLDPANDHALTTLLSIAMMIPAVLIFEPIDALSTAFTAFSMEDRNRFLFDSFVCGMSFYLYNEFQNDVLSDLGPVPTAVGNTLKRVAIFVGLYLFTPGEVFPMPKVIGCGVAIAGCLAYAVCNAKKI